MSHEKRKSEMQTHSEYAPSCSEVFANVLRLFVLEILNFGHELSRALGSGHDSGAFHIIRKVGFGDSEGSSRFDRGELTRIDQAADAPWAFSKDACCLARSEFVALHIIASQLVVAKHWGLAA